jgi:hemerythrin
MIEILKTTNPKIDAIHKEEVEIVERFLRAIESEDEKEISEVFSEFIEHLQEHFGFEESLMDGVGYTMANVHKNEHYKILSDAKYKLMNWNNFKDLYDLKEYVKEEFLVWLNRHIESMDKPMVEFLEGGK